MLSSVTVVDNDGNAVHQTQSSGLRNHSNPTTVSNHANVMNTSSSTRDMSPSTNFGETDTDLDTSVYQLARQHRRMRQYVDSGDATYTCVHCQARFWYGERTVRRSSTSNPRFSTCCSEGKVQLSLLHEPPPLLTELMDYNGGERSKLFRKKIKVFNSMFSFTSTRGNISRELNDGSGPYAFRLNGHNHHRIGTILPTH